MSVNSERLHDVTPKKIVLSLFLFIYGLLNDAVHDPALRHKTVSEQ
jgi:hypothetical protein